MCLFDALQDAIDSPCEPIAWKRSRLEDSEIAHNSLVDENFDFLSFEVPTLKFNTSIESQDSQASQPTQVQPEENEAAKQSEIKKEKKKRNSQEEQTQITNNM